MDSVWVIVVAAGVGARFGRLKQYDRLGGRRVLDWSLAAARRVADGLVLVVPEAQVATPEPAADVVVAGGPTRSASVRAGLAATPDDADVILVHDAARPLATPALFTATVEVVRSGADAAVPAVAVTDTLRRRSGGLVERDGLVAVQTPQAFRAAALRDAHVGYPEATDDASLVERAGGRVALIEGSPGNLKLTHPLDLVVAEALAAHAAGEAPAEPTGTGTSAS